MTLYYTGRQQQFMATHARARIDRGLLIVLASWGAAAVLLRPFENVPFVDDWVYAWSVENLITHGRLEVLDFSSNMVHVQALWGALFCLPFGFSFTALRLSTWALACLAIVGVHRLLRAADASEEGATLGAAALAAYPPFLVLSFSFMTDVPLLTAHVWALTFVVRAWRRQSARDLWIATGLCALAGGIRVVGIIPALAATAALLFDARGWGRARARFLVPMVAPLLVGGLALYHRSHVRHVADLTHILNTPEPRIEALREYALALLPAWLPLSLEFAAVGLGLALAPLAAGLLPEPGQRRRMVALAAASLLVVAVAQLAGGLHYPAFASEGTWLSDELGATVTLLPGWTPVTLPLTLSAAATLACWACFVVLGSLVTARDRLAASNPVLWWTVIGLILATAVLWLASDRYVLPLLAPGMALVCGAKARVSWPRALAVLIAFAVVGLVAVRDRTHAERALWSAVGDLRQRGVPAAAIDAGYVVNGWLQYAHPAAAHKDANGAVAVPFVNGDASLPWIVAAAPLPGTTVVTEKPFIRTGRPPGRLYVLRNPVKAY